MPQMVPTVEPKIKNRNCCPTSDSASVPATSTSFPVTGCWIILDILDTITITLNSDRADAINPTLAPDSLAA